ncbi:ribonuclease P protein subunit p40 [Callorhinchus milii]|uniref:Ribonuclease P/MRP 40 subunit n=1 Tax=Callorhinchus milii TaxID=7868 RepID=A0A4W3ISZ7_CALMI|nr:ribonuclease P protein subunit p40 [Callorhinchus milii]|eukprot:gi/632968998/ref/XP_007900844.1/ PREDICTED: ribonuclease P protein subunit p40 [Callorhinchus milii]
MLRELETCARRLLVCEKSNFQNRSSRHRQQVTGHHYNCQVSILIPECGLLPPGVDALTRGLGDYYLVKTLPVYEMIEFEFINTFVKKGGIYALSYNTRIDQNNTIALLPTGKLILSVDKDTYEELGLEGRPSQYSHRKTMRHIITVDLSDANFVPGKKRYNRVMWALKEKKPLTFDFLMAWQPTDPDGEGVNLQSYFMKYQCKVHRPTVSVRVVKDTDCPVLLSNEMEGKLGESCGSEELFDWLGGIFSHVNCKNQADSFLSTYCSPEPNTVLEKACLCTVTGFILPQRINQLLEQLRHYFDEPKLTQWVTMTVHGFADSPVSWGECEHGYHKGGENLYNFVVFNNQDYWLQMAVGTNSGCPP